MRRALFGSLALIAVGLMAGCGGGGIGGGCLLGCGGPPQPNALNGRYAFVLSGFDSSGNNIVFDGEPLASTALVTLANVFGDLLYDNTLVPIKGGAAYHYFGGGQQVTSGTFTIVWATGPGGGVMRVEVG